MSRTSDDDETIRKRSAWLIPIGVLLVVAVLSAMILLLYLAPGSMTLFEEQISPTSRTDVVPLKIHGHRFNIPANYLEYESTRQGGDHSEVALFALAPDMTGWSNWEAQTFAGNAPDSPVIFLILRDDKYSMSESERLKRVYLGYVADPRGEPGPFGLRQYAFREDSGYHNEDLFVGDTPQGPVVMRCVRLSPDVPNPSCLRDVPVASSVSLSYRFKLARLAQWREIGDGIGKLIKSFEVPSKQNAAQRRP